MNTLDLPRTIALALPDKFAFYHLGHVQKQQSGKETNATAADTDYHNAIAILMHGEIKATLILMLHDGLDPSIYSEFANIIASRLAKQLQVKENIEAMISPPLPLSSEQTARLTTWKGKTIRQTYLHTNGETSTTVEVLVLVDEYGGSGNA